MPSPFSEQFENFNNVGTTRVTESLNDFLDLLVSTGNSQPVDILSDYSSQDVDSMEVTHPNAILNNRPISIRQDRVEDEYEVVENEASKSPSDEKPSILSVDHVPLDKDRLLGSVRVVHVVVVVLAVWFSIAAVSSSSAAFYGQKFMAVDQDNKVLTMTCCTSFPLNSSDTVRWDRLEKGKHVETIAFFRVQKGNDKNGRFEASIDGSCLLMKIYNLTREDVGANYTLAVGHQNHKKDQVFFYLGSGPIYNGKEPLQNSRCNESNGDININLEMKHIEKNVTFAVVDEKGKSFVEDFAPKTIHDGLFYKSSINEKVKQSEIPRNGRVNILYWNERTSDNVTVYDCLTTDSKDQKEQKEGVQVWVIAVSLIFVLYLFGGICLAIRYYRHAKRKNRGTKEASFLIFGTEHQYGELMMHENAENREAIEPLNNTETVANGHTGQAAGECNGT